jgi:3-oxoacyl-[acyl-carrier protein] reductase
VERIAVVSGGCRGIGKAICDYLKTEGWEVYTFCRTHDGVDVRDYGQVKAWADKTFAGKRIQLIINNAGTCKPCLLRNMVEKDWKLMVDVNLYGTFNLTNTCLPYLEDGGNIISISSVAARLGNHGMTAYSASKAGVEAFTKCLSRELAKNKIRVNAIAPAVISTEMLLSGKTKYTDAIVEATPMKRMGTPEEVVQAVDFLLKATYVTGAIIDVNGGLL